VQLANAAFCAETSRGSKPGPGRGIETRARLSLRRTPHQHQAAAVPPQGLCFALLFRAGCCLFWLLSTFGVLAAPPGLLCCLQVWGWFLAAYSTWHNGCCWDGVGCGYEVLHPSSPLLCGHLMAVLVARPSPTAVLCEKCLQNQACCGLWSLFVADLGTHSCPRWL